MSTDDQQILIITGPNMSGKSSYLRQVGLIALLAQIGSFVPAKSATIGLVDRIYTRVGASDNIASGESTFLVEMHEAANIVNTATPRSLILLDEVGRGTSTFDGISIAWALTEYVHERVGARTLFATHYHELNELADLFSRIRNYKVDVREYGDKVVFLHKVTPGFADHSYGIQVAQMAGMPEEVTNKAKVILQSLEQFDLGLEENDRSNGKRSGRAKGRMKTSEIQMGLFELKDDSLRDELRAIDINSITPMEAMQKLAELKNRVDQQ
jgi:DNA mismatch repair protein MutS